MIKITINKEFFLTDVQIATVKERMIRAALLKEDEGDLLSSDNKLPTDEELGMAATIGRLIDMVEEACTISGEPDWIKIERIGETENE